MTAYSSKIATYDTTLSYVVNPTSTRRLHDDSGNTVTVTPANSAVRVHIETVPDVNPSAKHS